MLKRLRERNIHCAAALVVLLATVGIPHSTDAHYDVDDGFVLVAHDESAHRVIPATAATDTHPLHCLVCHLMRSFRPRTEVRNVSTPPARGGARIHTATLTASSAAPVAQPPLRSPPVSPISA